MIAQKSNREALSFKLESLKYHDFTQKSNRETFKFQIGIIEKCHYYKKE